MKSELINVIDDFTFLAYLLNSARHGFLKCVYVASRLKCKKEEALFLKKIADTLSNMRVYSKHCKNVDVTFCSGGGLKNFSPPDVIIPLLVLWVVLKLQ